MHANYDHHWRSLWTRRPFKRAFVVSLVVHLCGVGALVYAFYQAPNNVKPVTYEVQVMSLPDPEPQQEEPVQEVVPPPPPQPEPEPKPEPEPVPPKPEPEPEKTAKIEEKPEKKEEKKPEPKPDPPKPEEKPPEPKPDPPKPKPEPKPIEPVEPEPQKVAKREPEKKDPEPQRTGVQMERQLPSELNTWGRLVQRKVEKYWTVPGGIKIDNKDNEAMVSFWVDRNGRLIGEPEVVKHASDTALGESGVRAIMAAAPLPPLPVGYKQDEQQVVYVFTLAR